MKYYASPRWSGEILDCSMPMTFDTYDRCSYNCLYCFSFFQKSHSLGEGGSFTGKHQDYQEWESNHVDVARIKKIFSLDPTCPETSRQFFPYIQRRKTFQWGGLSDPFDENERRKGITLELLNFFKSIDYPICFSTKGTWWTEDDRYMKLISGQKNWNFKFSIICLDPVQSKNIEIGCPLPEERLTAMRRVADAKCGGITLRLRPFIIGLTDIESQHLRLIEEAYKCGAGAVSTEFFCVEGRADIRLKKRYRGIEKIIGFDLLKFYGEYSKGTGYMRLNRKVKEPYIDQMREICKKLGVRFYVSDAHFKEYCNNASCCGLSEEWNYSRGTFTQALLIAKKRGTVKFRDIKKEIDELHSAVLFYKAEGFNTGGMEKRVQFRKYTMADWFRLYWNNPNLAKSPYKYFGGILIPCGKDEDNNIVYEYKGKQ